MIRINSGAPEPTDKFNDTPRDKWFFLMLAKRDFLSTNLAYDCRCLVEFCEEAELVYSDCGFKSAAEMIQHGYELDPVEIELAVAWLKHNQPKQEVGLETIAKTADKVRQFKEENPNWTQQRIAEEVGVSRQYVHKVLSTNKFESKDVVDTPDHLTGSEAKADFRKLPEDVQEQVDGAELHPSQAATRS